MSNKKIPQNTTLEDNMSPFWSPKRLAKNWGMKEASLAQMRYQNRGPAYFKPSKSIVRYPVSEIRKYEQEHMHWHTAEY